MQQQEKSQKEDRREEVTEEKEPGERIKVREKVEKVAKHCVFSNVLRTPKVEK